MRCVWRTCAPPAPAWPQDSQIYLVRISMSGLPSWTAAIEWRRVPGEDCRWGIGAENQHWVTHWLDGVEMPSEATTDVEPEPEPWQWMTLPAHRPDDVVSIFEVESRDYAGRMYYSRRMWVQSPDGEWMFSVDGRGRAVRWRPIS